MFYQRFYRYPLCDCRYTDPLHIDKKHLSGLFLDELSYLSTEDKLGLFLILFAIFVQFFIIISGSATIYSKDGKENTEEEEDVKGTYI